MSGSGSDSGGNSGPTTPATDDPLGAVVESFLDRFRRGERPALTELVARHPDLAGRIRELIPALVELEQLGAASADLGESRGTPSGTAWAGVDSAALPDRLGDYAILRPIGGGGMGMVYEAEHTSLRNRVALKVMHPRFRADPRYLRRFHDEARLAAGLHHTNIVSVFDYGEQAGVCYYAMQFIQGQPLDRILADIARLREAERADGHGGSRTTPVGPDEGPPIDASAPVRGLLTGVYAVAPGDIPTTAVGVAVDHPAPPDGPTDLMDPAAAAPADPEAPAAGSSLGSSSLSGSAAPRYHREIARVAAQVADALDYAHHRGVVHRDVKPSNLLLDALGNVWVTDFGLARLEEGEGITQSRELVGTLRYMAPERLRGKSDRRGDVYSLGATLYELVTLQPPFDADDQVRLMEQIREESPPPPRQHDPSVPRDLETIILKALAKDPRDRFATAGELADELRRFVEGRPIRSRPISAAERFVRWCRRDPWLARATIAAAVLAVALAVGSTWAALVFRGQVRQIKDQRDQIGRALGKLTRADQATRRNLFDALAAQARSSRFSRRPGQRFGSLAALHRAADLARELELPPEEFDRLRDEAIACLALPDVEAVGRPLGEPAQVWTIFDRGMTRYAQRFRDGTIVVRSAVGDRELARFRAHGDRDFWVFTFSPDGRFLASSDSPSQALRVWDIDRGTLAVEDPGPVEQTVQFRPDGRRIFVPRQGRLHEYDLESRRLFRTWPGRASQIAAHPDGKRIAAVDNTTRPPTCQILGEGSDRPIRSFSLRAPTYFLTWSPDGRTLVTAGDDYKLDVWDAVAGIHRATLEGHVNHGLLAAFHPSGALLASDGWEKRLRLWDPILSRPVLSLPGASPVVFRPDGRIVVDLDHRLTTYRVNAALEYRALAFASAEVPDYADPSVRHDGRLLAVGTNRGAVIWDLARGTELAFLAIGNSWHVKFDPAGDLVTSGDVGVQRWAVRINPDSGTCRIGPPRALPLPATHGGLDMDRSGRIVAVANRRFAQVAVPGRSFPVGPLDDCRSVAVSPDGQWLATGSHVASRGAQVWRIADGRKVKELPIDGGTSVSFSPDGRWLAAGYPRLKLWEVGTWKENTRIGDAGRFFSPDGRIMAVVEPDQSLRLVEVETGHTLARLEGPDGCTVKEMTFSPDGSRLAVTTDEPPSARVWDLRAIRRKLAERGLDWQAPAYPSPDPADPTLPSLSPAEVDYGALAGHIEDFLAPRETLIRRYTDRLARDPRDFEAYHHRAHALAGLGRYREAVADLSRAIALRPGDGHLHALRGAIHRQILRDHEAAVADFEAALASPEDAGASRLSLAQACNDRAWELANAPARSRDVERALWLVRRSLKLEPGENTTLNTLGVVLYRAGRYDEAIEALERSLAAGRGQLDAFDLYFLAMAHHRLGHREPARACFNQAIRWVERQTNLDPGYSRELAGFRAEAESVLAGPPVPVQALPGEVFTRGR